MPLYEYECDACQHRFEILQRISDPVKQCPKCGGAVHKLQSAPAIQFKGTGWYVTDYAKKDTAGGNAQKSDGDSKAETTSGAATDKGGEKSGGEKGGDKSSDKSSSDSTKSKSTDSGSTTSADTAKK
jgi:putative FmdB family regulatory protein